MKKGSNLKYKNIIESGKCQLKKLQTKLQDIQKNIEQVQTKITQQQQIKQNIMKYNEKNEQMIRLESKMSILNEKKNEIDQLIMKKNEIDTIIHNLKKSTGTQSIEKEQEQTVSSEIKKKELQLNDLDTQIKHMTNEVDKSNKNIQRGEDQLIKKNVDYKSALNDLKNYNSLLTDCENHYQSLELNVHVKNENIKEVLTSLKEKDITIENIKKNVNY